MTKIKCVLVGAGRMGQNHLRLLREMSAFELVAVVDKAPLALPSGLQQFADIADVPLDSFECAVVATPTPTHFDVAKYLMTSRKHVLVEKPLSHTREHAVILSNLSREHNVHLAVGHVERFNPAVKKLRAVIASGFLGVPIHFDATRVGGFPAHISRGDNVLLDLAVHDIDVVRTMAPNLSLSSSVVHSTVKEGVLDTAAIHFHSEGGASASLHVNWVTPTKIRTLRVTGTRGVCVVDYILQTCVLYGGNLLNAAQPQSLPFDALQQFYRSSDRIEFGVTQAEPLRAELSQFARLVDEGDRGDLADAEDATRAVELATEAFASAKSFSGLRLV